MVLLYIFFLVIYSLNWFKMVLNKEINFKVIRIYFHKILICIFMFFYYSDKCFFLTKYKHCLHLAFNPSGALNLYNIHQIIYIDYNLYKVFRPPFFKVLFYTPIFNFFFIFFSSLYLFYFIC